MIGQDEESSGELFAVTVGVLPMMDFYQGSSYRIGIEKRLNHATSIFIQGGGYLPNFNLRSDFKGYNVRAEYKIFFKRENDSPVGQYVALDCFHKNQAYTRIDTIRTDFIDDYTTKNRLNKSTTCINIKYGYTQGASKKIFFDIFAGLGLRIKNTRSNLSDEVFENIDTGDSQTASYELERGLLYRPNLTLGFRIGYRLR